MQSVETVNPEVQRLLRFKPSPARTGRAAVSATDGKPKHFLDLVGSVESNGYGGYDAYNLGGSNEGFTAHGSGNSAEDNRFGAPLSQLTVAEVMQLGSNQQIWAAGKYQFIPSTLRETVAFIGLDPSRLFDAATQDELALGRLRWRNQVDPGLAGLRREWIGLNYVSDEELLSALVGVLLTTANLILLLPVYKWTNTTVLIGVVIKRQQLNKKRCSKKRHFYVSNKSSKPVCKLI